MLDEKMKMLSDLRPLELAKEAIGIAKPIKGAIEEGCEKLKKILESSEFSAVDGEIKTALTSVYHILETAGNGLSDTSVVALFG